MDSQRVLAGMSVTMQALLTQRLSDHMKSLSMAQARTLAHEMTLTVSAHVAKAQSTHGANTAVHVPCFPKETWNELTVGVPWEAYSHAYGAYAGQPVASGTQALCSAPQHLDSYLATQSASSGLWGGSLLVALAKILEGVRDKLVIFSPYWRTDGTQALLAAAGRQSYQGIQVSIFTQPKARMKESDREGLSYFAKILRQAGAQVSVLAPKPHEGLAPILHAKLIIADRMRAYVGSANFTKSGLDHGLEAGVLVEGQTASAFSVWADAIEATCVPW
ncbi:phospholipase D-like domain-containing protein [Cupriavidus pinatubonensis]|uniref:phospholipase D-like domain-containing protein n=1 Tax=Cupriavidus pinatubonensis TaxID=248026 RepID=UPI001129B1A0|nr:phospholipase D-like domain-containing protein [Cupriavidus pinatubonensis]